MDIMNEIELFLKNKESEGIDVPDEDIKTAKTYIQSIKQILQATKDEDQKKRMEDNILKEIFTDPESYEMMSLLKKYNLSKSDSN